MSSTASHFSQKIQELTQFGASIFDNNRDFLIFDCGSSYTRVFEGKRLVFEEPTALAIQSDTGAVLAIGKQARNLIGKTPPGVKVFFPIESGRVAYPDQLKTYLQVVVKRITSGFALFQNFIGVRGRFALPSAITPIETQLYEEVLQRAGLGGLKLESGITGSYKSIDSSSKQKSSYCVASLGAQTAQVGIFSAGQLAYETRWNWGGIRFTEMIQDIMRHEEQLAVSWHTAEAVKLELPSLLQNRSRNSKVAVRGKDILSQSSKTAVVTVGIFATAFEQYISELLENFELFISELPTELANSCLENGIYLTGGSSQISDLNTLLAEYLHTPVRSHLNPSLATAQGLVKMHIK